MKLRTQILGGYFLIFVFMIIIAVVMSQSIGSLVDTSQWVSHTHEVISEARSIEKLMVDMETGQRGFLITGEEAFLDPYEQGKRDYTKTLAHLRSLVTDNPPQLKRLDEIDLLIAKWHEVAASVEIAERRQVNTATVDAEYLQDLLSKGVGKRILDTMRQEIDRLDDLFRRTANREGRYLALAIAKAMVDMETGQRGYLVTGQQEFLEPFNAGMASVGEHFKALRAVTPQVHQTRIDRLEELSNSWIDKAGNPEIAARTEMNQSKSSLKKISALIQQGTGKSIMDALRVKVAEFIQIENELLVKRNDDARGSSTSSLIVVVIGTALAIALGLVTSIFITRSVHRQVGGEPASIERMTSQVATGDLTVAMTGVGGKSTGILASVQTLVTTMKGVVKQANTIAGGDYSADISPRSDKDELAIALKSMTKKLRESAETTAAQDWLKTGLNRLNSAMQGDLGVAQLAEQIVSELAVYLEAQLAAVYLTEDHENAPVLNLQCSYGYTKRKNLSNRFGLGEGLVGQAAKEKKQILISNVPEGYVKVSSGLGEASPAFIAVTPLVFENRVVGVIELGTLGEITDLQLEYLNQAVVSVAINFEAANGREELARELDKSQTLSEELQSQQEELKASNEELEEQTQRLQQSEEELKASNESLEEKSEMLQRQKKQVEQSRKEIEQKAKELSIASKYKSEFLANMSHELRTPLNSLLILSQSMADNEAGNLTEDQVRSASIINSCGNDLLALINEILDLAKIEAGRMDIKLTKIPVEDLVLSIRRSFAHMAEEKGLEFKVTAVDPSFSAIFTDRKRLEQIIKNLLSNAIKFTDKGAVEVTIARATGEAGASPLGLDPDECFTVNVSDTGIGIPADKQQEIFEAFQQVDGTTSRMHSGTGLGLSISRELARLLGGEIGLHSRVGEGSTFTVYLPVHASHVPASDEPKRTSRPHQPGSRALESLPAAQEIDDDRASIEGADKVILIIEDDPRFASLLLKQCHEKGFKCVASATGERGLDLTRTFMPRAIILDLKLPGMDGWAVLDALKDDPKTRHIPVHIMSVEESSLDARRKGAIGHLTKPARKEELEEAFERLEETITRGLKELLVIEDDDDLRESIIKLIGNGDVRATAATTGEEALALLRNKKFDCVILDLGLPDMNGFELLEQIESDTDVTMPPVVVYTGRDLTREQEERLFQYTESIIIKGVQSEERLLDETSLFLHRLVDAMPERKQQMIANLHDRDALFEGKRVMLVDDDMRNVFALSEVLQKKGLQVHKAENGRKALAILEQEKEIDLVLMDIMMPEMDGYETMRRIREQKELERLPIIALTAKAMKQDREKCFAAGASDYLSKPVDVNRLLSLMRVWLYR
ncbi:MAG: response regulator [Myxococcota bacterium]|nr:response regulator [Myxococcota bacterium]